MKDKVSVVTICYNLADSIEKTLRSVLDQTYSNLEYVIVDGGSKDATQSVIERVLSEYSSAEVNYKSERDGGIYDAMNRGLERATGDWVIFMNGGDWFHSSDTIEKFIPQIEPDTIIAHGDIISEGKGYRYRVKPWPLEMMNRYMAVKHQATFTRLSYHKAHPFDITYRSAGDYDFFYKAHFSDHVKFQYIPMIVGHFQGWEGESTSNKWNSHLEYLRVRGVQSNAWEKFMIRCQYWDIAWKGWVKRHLLSEKKARDIEIARIRRAGGSEIEID